MRHSKTVALSDWYTHHKANLNVFKYKNQNRKLSMRGENRNLKVDGCQISSLFLQGNALYRRVREMFEVHHCFHDNDIFIL